MLTKSEWAVVHSLRNAVLLMRPTPRLRDRTARIGNLLLESVRETARVLREWFVATYGPKAIKTSRLRRWWGI